MWPPESFGAREEVHQPSLFRSQRADHLPPLPPQQPYGANGVWDFLASSAGCLVPALALAGWSQARGGKGRPRFAGRLAAVLKGTRGAARRKAVASSGTEAADPRGGTQRHLFCLYSALCSMVGAQAVVSQALPCLLQESIGSADVASERLADVTSLSAALEFLFLPVMANYSDCHGRRRLLLLVPLLALCLQGAVLLAPSTATVVASRLLLGLLLEAFILLVSISTADIFQENSTMLADFEGRSAALHGGAFAVGMLIGGRALAQGTTLLALQGAFGWSAALTALAFALVFYGAKETFLGLPDKGFRLKDCSPLGFLRLFRSGRALLVLSIVFSLQALHDGEGDVWQVYATVIRGWGTTENAIYGAAAGIASTVGGLFTGLSVRLLGWWLHTVTWSLSTGLSLLLFMSRSSLLAFGSVIFSSAEDCMSAAVFAKMMLVGGRLGLGRGRLASDIHNLEACFRVAGLFGFGRLFAVGLRAGFPQLAYVVCALAQLAAALLMLLLPRGDDRADDRGRE